MANFKVKGLSVSYQQKHLFEKLTFEVSFPAFVAIVGSNGSGKTSFFKAILNKLPFKGEITYEGQLLDTSLVATLPQKNHLQFDIKVLDVVVMGLYASKGTFQHYSKKDYNKALKVLHRFGIEELASQNFQTLSGGEQQLVWLAQLILQDKKILLLDEPLQQLDVKNKVKVTKVLQEEAYQHNKLIFCITHDLHLLNEHNQGWILNLSEKEQELLPITQEHIEKHLALLLA